MKKILFCSMLLIITSASFSQQTNPSQPLTREEYLKKSKSQKTGAWIFLGVGAAMFAIAAPGNVSFDVLGTIVVVGTIATIVSIPLFIASARNKRKAKAATAFLKFEKNHSIQQTGITLHSYPALSLKINL